MRWAEGIVRADGVWRGGCEPLTGLATEHLRLITRPMSGLASCSMLELSRPRRAHRRESLAVRVPSVGALPRFSGDAICDEAVAGGGAAYVGAPRWIFWPVSPTALVLPDTEGA